MDDFDPRTPALISAAPALLAAAGRLRPAEGRVTPEMPDDEVVNLVTTAGALRQLQAALAAAEYVP